MVKRIGALLLIIGCSFSVFDNYAAAAWAAAEEPLDINIADESAIGAGKDLEFAEKERFDIKRKREEVITMVDETIAFIEKKTFNEAMDYINHTRNFKHGELYPFVYDDKGVCLAHGEDSNMVWWDMSQVKDSFGDPFIMEMIKKAEAGGGWHTYQWRDASKSSYVKMMVKDGQKLMIGSGFYPHSKADAVVSLVKGAVAYFNDRIAKGIRPVEIMGSFSYQLGDFIVGDISIYALTKDVVVRASSSGAFDIGQSYHDIKDGRGNFFLRIIVDTMKDVPLGEGRWFEYHLRGMIRLSYVERVIDNQGVSYFIGSAYNPTADREAAVELVKRGYQFMKAHGRTSIVDAINDQTQGRFKIGPLSLFIYDYKGMPIAYGSNTALVGKNMFDVKDESGRYMVREILDKAKNEGAGWLDFRWRKSFYSMYVEDIDLGSERFVIGTGVYPLTKESTMVLMVKSAKGFFKMNSNEDAFREFVDPKSTFIRGDMGIFVIDTDGICYADRDRFDLIWKDLSGEKDDDGKLYFKAMINASKMGPAKVMYKKNNARKVAYIETVKKGDKTFIIGSSFYP
jgi:hypothetical protein